MKKIILGIFGIGLFATAHAQTQGAFGFELGLRGAAASNWLFNSNVSGGGSTQNYAPAFSYNYGLDITFDFSDHVAVEANLLFGTITQGYNGQFGSNEYIPLDPLQDIVSGEKYVSKTQLNVMAIPLLLRMGSGNGAYVEIGPEYQIVQGALFTETFTGGPANAINYSNVNVAPAFATSNIQGVLGFGDDFQIGSSGLNIITNLRFYYGFTDLKGVDGHGQNMNSSFPDGTANNQLYTYPYGGTGAPYYASYKPTHSAGVSFSIGAYYYLPITTSKGGRHACKHPPKVRS